MPHLLWAWRPRQLPLGLYFRIIAVDPQFISSYGFLDEIWFVGSSLDELATAPQCSFCFGSRSRRMNFVMMCFRPRSCIKTLDTVVFGIPRSDASSHTISHQHLLIADCTHPTFSGVLLGAGLKVFVPNCYLHCTHCIVPKSLQNHLNSFHGGMFKLNSKFDVDLLLCSLSHFECDSHTVHIHAHSMVSPIPTD